MVWDCRVERSVFDAVEKGDHAPCHCLVKPCGFFGSRVSIYGLDGCWCDGLECRLGLYRADFDAIGNLLRWWDVYSF